jgi:predicted transcriptional regulator
MTGTVADQLEKREKARDLRKSGLSYAQIAAIMGVTPPAVSYWLRQPKSATAAKLARQTKLRKKIVDTYLRGATMAAIGATLKISGERVRQILKEHQIVGAPRTSTRADKQAAIQARKEKRVADVWGLDWDTYRQLRDSFEPKASPFLRYTEQRRNARVRKIPWRMTFAEWWGIWQTSGKWTARGRGNGYCMARRGDVGPYAVGNVEIITTKENSRQARVKTLSKSF